MREKWMFLTILVVIMVGFQGCTKTWTEKTVVYQTPNWTSDGKVIFIENLWVYQHEKKFLFPQNGWQIYQELWLWECNSDGTGMNRIGLLFSAEPSTGNPTNTSSAGDWVTFSIGDTKEIYIVKRDGTELKKVGEGTYPDFSPDAEKIVYQKPEQGIWIINRDGSGEHSVWGDSLNKMPSWCSDGDRIAMEHDEGWGNVDVWIVDTTGNNKVKLLDTDFHYSIGPFVWAPVDTNGLVIYNTIYYLESFAQVDTIRELPSASYRGWSSDGAFFTGTDADGIFVMKVDGTGKIHIK
ncbi:MAG: hypothetical protein E3J70_07725 [Candidatus Heimdallarchaeota archaeon]|nr:MAG: hypothetical protein E3J70_07725 [Candidatus Heimdallarchaeota archaeon]